MLTVIRHGSTSFNEDGQERLRGWRDIPLSNKGVMESQQVAQMAQQQGLNGATYLTSPLTRAVQTAQALEPAVGASFQPTDSLKDWNIGHFAGQSVKDSLGAIHSYLDQPDQPVPGGESYRDFLNRTLPLVTALVQDPQNHVAVTHNRIVTLLKALSDGQGQSIPISVLKQAGPIEPGGVAVVKPDWSFTVLDRPNPEMSQQKTGPAMEQAMRAVADSIGADNPSAASIRDVLSKVPADSVLHRVFGPAIPVAQIG